MATSLRYGSGMVKDDVIYCALPLYHTNGGILGAGQMLLYGNALALRRKFSASNFWNDCIKYKCTVRMMAIYVLNYSIISILSR